MSLSYRVSKADIIFYEPTVSFLRRVQEWRIFGYLVTQSVLFHGQDSCTSAHPRIKMNNDGIAQFSIYQEKYY